MLVTDPMASRSVVPRELVMGMSTPHRKPTVCTLAATSGLKLSGTGTESDTVVSKSPATLVTPTPATTFTHPLSTFSVVGIVRLRLARPFKFPFFKNISPSKFLKNKQMTNM